MEWVVGAPNRQRFTLGERPPVPIGYEAGWVSELAWTHAKEKSFTSAKDRTPVVQSAVRHADWSTPAPICV
jgi:hypothetical protein